MSFEDVSFIFLMVYVVPLRLELRRYQLTKKNDGFRDYLLFRDRLPGLELTLPFREHIDTISRNILADCFATWLDDEDLT